MATATGPALRGVPCLTATLELAPCVLALLAKPLWVCCCTPACKLLTALKPVLAGDVAGAKLAVPNLVDPKLADPKLVDPDLAVLKLAV